MRISQQLSVILTAALVLAFSGTAFPQAKKDQPAKAPAPAAPVAADKTNAPDHCILYRRAVALMDKAQKKLAARYTAEAKNLVKEANNLFTILKKEAAPTLKERTLSQSEQQQEQANQKLAADAQAHADRLMKSSDEKQKKGEQAENQGQADVAKKYYQDAKTEAEQAQVQYIHAQLYALKTQQMLFSFCAK
jgi:hypothetical protein